MSDFPTPPEADDVDKAVAPVTGSAPQQADAAGASALPDGTVAAEGVVDAADVVAPEQGTAAGEPAPLDPDDTEH